MNILLYNFFGDGVCAPKSPCIVTVLRYVQGRAYMRSEIGGCNVDGELPICCKFAALHHVNGTDAHVCHNSVTPFLLSFLHEYVVLLS